MKGLSPSVDEQVSTYSEIIEQTTSSRYQPVDVYLVDSAGKELCGFRIDTTATESLPNASFAEIVKRRIEENIPAYKEFFGRIIDGVISSRAVSYLPPPERPE